MKRNVMSVLVLIFVLSVGWLTMGCSRVQPQEGVLDVWAMWAEDPKELQGLLDGYSLASGVPVKVSTGIKSDEVLEALSGETAPDLVILSSSDLVLSYHKQGLVEPLEPWIDPESIDLGDFYPAPLAQCISPDGTLLCLPWTSDVYALFWNKDRFRAAGLDPERPPQTMEELAEYAAKLTLRDDEGGLSQAGFIPDLSRSHGELYARLFGGSWANDEGAGLTVHSQPVVDAMAWQRQFYSESGTEETVRFVSSLNRYLNSRHPVYAGKRMDCRQCHRDPPGNAKTPERAFYSGKVAMAVDGAWQVALGGIARFAPELDYGVAPFPPPDGHAERANTSVVQGAVIILPAEAEDMEAAASLLAWMMSPETVAEVAHERASLPVRRSAARDSRFQQVPQLGVFVDLLAHCNAVPSATTSIGAELNVALGQAEREALHDGGDPSLLLGKVQSELESRLEQVSGYVAIP